MKILIFDNFDAKYCVWVKTNTSYYAIGRVLDKLTLDNLG